MALYFSKCCETKKLIKDCVKVYMINDVATMENKRSMWMQKYTPIVVHPISELYLDRNFIDLSTC